MLCLCGTAIAIHERKQCLRHVTKCCACHAKRKRSLHACHKTQQKHVFARKHFVRRPMVRLIDLVVGSLWAVANGCEHAAVARATLGEHDSNLQTSRVKRRTLRYAFGKQVCKTSKRIFKLFFCACRIIINQIAQFGNPPRVSCWVLHPVSYVCCCKPLFFLTHGSFKQLQAIRHALSSCQLFVLISSCPRYHLPSHHRCSVDGLGTPMLLGNVFALKLKIVYLV